MWNLISNITVGIRWFVRMTQTFMQKEKSRLQRHKTYLNTFTPPETTSIHSLIICSFSIYCDLLLLKINGQIYMNIQNITTLCNILG